MGVREDKGGVGEKKAGIDQLADAGDVDSCIVRKGMIAVHEKDGRSEDRDPEQGTLADDERLCRRDRPAGDKIGGGQCGGLSN